METSGAGVVVAVIGRPLHPKALERTRAHAAAVPTCAASGPKAVERDEEGGRRESEAEPVPNVVRHTGGRLVLEANEKPATRWRALHAACAASSRELRRGIQKSKASHFSEIGASALPSPTRVRKTDNKARHRMTVIVADRPSAAVAAVFSSGRESPSVNFGQ